MIAAKPATKNVRNLAVIILSIPVLIQIIVKIRPVKIVTITAFPLYLFQKRDKRITTENVPPIPAQT
jgi:hypothetical protein